MRKKIYSSRTFCIVYGKKQIDLILSNELFLDAEIRFTFEQIHHAHRSLPSGLHLMNEKNGDFRKLAVLLRIHSFECAICTLYSPYSS